MKLKKLLLIALAVLTGTISYAQSTKKTEKKSEKPERTAEEARDELEEENDPPFKKHSVFGVKISTDGLGISYEIGKFKTIRRTTLLQFELNEKYHPKEEKQTVDSDIFGNVSRVKYGKANNFYQFKVGYGQQHLIGGKAEKNGVAVSAMYAGGLSVGIVKPYYVDVHDNNANEDFRYKFEDTIADNVDPVLSGASGFTTGWNEVKFKPGIHAKAALRFDYGRFRESVTAIETGISLEYYPSNIKQMTVWNFDHPATFITRQNRMFFNAYITILFGKRK